MRRAPGPTLRSAEPPSSEDAPTLAVGRPDRAESTGVEHPGAPTIAGYRIIQRLGAGGMGVVFEAEQDEPRRRVALKVIRGGALVDDTQVRLFQREAQALARLRHPGIAAIHAAGRTATGEHFFAMELVRGRDLGAWLSSRGPRLDRAELRMRVRLLAELAAAVHHAHLRGVIHRDLKPSNLLIAEEEAAGPEGVPAFKVLDFGLARIVAEGEDGASMLTQPGMVMGTLPYMAPEVVTGTGDPADVRADVYALGVVLYQMLTGRKPLEVTTSSIVEAVRTICDVAPPPLRQHWPGPVALDGDLQTIIDKALEKDVERRYASADALADDLTRWLDDRPIAARPASRADRFAKFVRRNRTLVAGAGATALALIAGLVAATFFGLREAEQRRAADAARAEAQEVADFQAAMLSGVDAPGMGRRLVDDLAARIESGTLERGGDAATAAARVRAFRDGLGPAAATDAALRVIDDDVLARALVAADSQFAGRPHVHARLLASIGSTYMRLGLLEKAEVSLRRAGERFAASVGGDARAALDAARAHATALTAQGRTEEAEPVLRRTLARQHDLLGPDSLDALMTLNDLAVMYTDVERYAEAESLFLDGVPRAVRNLGAEHPFTLSMRHNHAWMLTSQGERFAEAESLMVPLLAARRRVQGDRHPETLQTIGNLGVLYRRMGRDDLAEPLYREDFAAARAVLGDEHPDLAVTMTNLGRLLIAQQKYEEAEALLARAIAITRRAAPPGFFGLGVSCIARGEALAGLGRHRESVESATEAHRILHALRGDDDPGVQRAVRLIADGLAATGRGAEAARWRSRLPAAP